MVKFMEMSEFYTESELIFQRLKANQPTSGDILSTPDGEPICLKINRSKDKPVVYCHAAINVDQEKWVLTEEDIGIICLILPYSWDKIKTHGNSEIVTKLQVRRYTKKGTGILAEIIE